MLIRHRKPWMLTDNAVTPEPLYRSRREIIAAGAAGLASVALTGCARAEDTAAPADATTSAEGTIATADGENGLTYRTTDYAVDAELTPYDAVTSYNNFYEFGPEKDDPARHAHNMTIDPWSVEIAGLAERTGTFGVEDLVDFNALEERIYRLRCVERWSMVIPWVGVPLSSVLAKFNPLSGAKYVAFETHLNPREMRGTRRSVIGFPYVEGLRIDEAMHPLTLAVVGLYGETLPKQNGAPFRVVIPWKYGYKGAKSIARITFTENEPPTAWGNYDSEEYGFYSNVNPEVRHPRWSQEFERIIGGRGLDQRRTEMFNGYGGEVAHLYEGMDLTEFH